MDEEVEKIKRLLLDFEWWDFSLDIVSDAQSDEWAEVLAERIANA